MGRKFQFNLNPIMVKEFRSRMRGWRGFAILTTYLLFLGLFSYGMVQLVLSTSIYGPSVPLSPLIGQSVFSAIVMLSMFVVVFLTPALTATAISSEQEKLTLEMLQATPLSEHSILLGKLTAAAGYIVLLLVAAVPVVSLVFTFGGVAPIDIVLSGLVIVSTGITFGMVGLFFSVWRKRTIQAVVASYLVVLLLGVGTLIAAIFWGSLTREFPPRFLFMLNPFSALASVTASQGQIQGGGMELMVILAGRQPYPPTEVELRPLWHFSLAIYLGLTLTLYFLASRMIKPIRPWRLGRQALAAVLVIAALYLGGSGFLFQRDVSNALTTINATPTPMPFVEPFMQGPIPTPVPLELEPSSDEPAENNSNGE